MSHLRIILTAIDKPLADAWQRYCGDLRFVTVHHGPIFDVACDAVVSPANSFGFMDGGIDRLYTEFFGRGVQDRLQDCIRGCHHGELLVGQAEVVATDHPATPFLIAAPTMRASSYSLMWGSVSRKIGCRKTTAWRLLSSAQKGSNAGSSRVRS